ncbi:YidC/Oxa1 family membrane protein insertase [Marivirga sericea]|uniref:Membrane protein insertase YidC n=1 Tax=Marivirga sericea TaxID=1028 RepID=A0A1X7ILS4_9BACT|nr:membrane protein insertase YidC [Marivirga sericea]SMG15512.1 YidC/Oxa1 family membrane protein insertase [Marivirga sericea]
MDKNQATGLILISILMIAYFWFFADTPQQPENIESNQVEQNDQQSQEPISSSNTESTTAIENDSSLNQAIVNQYGAFAGIAKGESKISTFNTETLAIQFDSKGGRVKSVQLKEFETFDGQPLIITNQEDEEKELLFNTASGEVNLFDLYFEMQGSPTRTLSNGDTIQVKFVAQLAPNKSIEQIYTLSGNQYQVGYSLAFNGFTNEILGDQLTLRWNKKMRKFEKDLAQSRTKVTMNYYSEEEGMDGLSERSDEDSEEIAAPVKWFSFKQNFFMEALITDIPMKRAEFATDVEDLSDEYVKRGKAKVEIPLAEVTNKAGEFKYYFGPNNYKTLQKVAPDFEENVYLGWFPISLVNKYVIINVFYVLEKYISSYGLIIIILVFLIKLALSPLSYKSYVSMAKTKVLKPQLDEIKEKHGGDMQKAQADQMDLYRKVGVNPLSGCIPLLLQMPILFAMFYFFPSSIELRQESFLWASDLSTYDSVLSLPFEIPFYGDHVSLFTILMTLSTLLITWSQGQVSSVQGPMKNIQYFMPVIFMFVLNSFPAALSFYYLIANLITFGQQTLIRRMIDEDKIIAILEENKKKNANKKTSKFQQRLQEAMKASEEAKKEKDKKNKKKKK